MRARDQAQDHVLQGHDGGDRQHQIRLERSRVRILELRAERIRNLAHQAARGGRACGRGGARVAAAPRGRRPGAPLTSSRLEDVLPVAGVPGSVWPIFGLAPAWGRPGWA